MKLYLIGGLGADERVFEYLNLNCATQTIKWIKPNLKEGLEFVIQRK